MTVGIYKYISFIFKTKQKSQKKDGGVEYM